MKPTYDRDYFIAKFEGIPEGCFRTGSVYKDHNGACCAWGHVAGPTYYGNPLFGWLFKFEAKALARLLPADNPKRDGIGYTVTRINDGNDPRYQQPTPKARILAALRDLPSTPKE